MAVHQTTGGFMERRAAHNDSSQLENERSLLTGHNLLNQNLAGKITPSFLSNT